jgi:hypothetical protein
MGEARPVMREVRGLWPGSAAPQSGDQWGEMAQIECEYGLHMSYIHSGHN